MPTNGTPRGPTWSTAGSHAIMRPINEYSMRQRVLAVLRRVGHAAPREIAIVVEEQNVQRVVEALRSLRRSGEVNYIGRRTARMWFATRTVVEPKPDVKLPKPRRWCDV